ncbi:NAD(P)H-hydrate epimerase [Parerythrobacter aestuarii]|uniref:NAD(P)H-hydrate epimerase n=1 Tax=Parerythrobacter aestuarii TaxID=3020909 RepID=UPI0024DEC86B|nr:NAD(P)H-hydrate epimerase [Parerythrobacter aestuarii]
MPDNARLRQILTVAQMQAAEQALIDAGTSVEELMQRAGKGAAEWVWRISGGRPVTVLCGPGNNGGDGYVIATEIMRRGGEARVIAPLPPKTDAARDAAFGFDGEVLGKSGEIRGDVFVDCLFGSGLSRPLSETFRRLVAGLQAHHVHSVAIDVPSGVDANSGNWPVELAAFDCTIALGAWKRAHWLGEAAARSGTKRLVEIGVADQGCRETLSPRPMLATPQWDAHKYRRGLVAVAGGAMPGAAVLAARSAMGAGAGYVKLFSEVAGPVPADLVHDVAPLPVALSGSRIAAVLIGPGLGRDEAARARLADALSSGRPIVLDADALVLLDNDLLEGVDTSRMVITPHEGELAKLCETFGIEGADKRERAIALHERTGATVLAKGPDTLLTHAGGVTYFPAGASWLSVAGSGDVLAGIVASRLAAHGDPVRAASEGVWLHHEAARQAGVAFSASDLAQSVACAYAAFL